MNNKRPCTDPHLEACRAEILAVIQHYDLAGAVCLANEHEWAYAYQLSATWNGFVDDDTTPLGFRIRIQTDTLGAARAQAFAEGTVGLIGALKDFSTQTSTWMQDLFRILRKAGMQITHRPFGGKRPPRLSTH